MKEVCTFPHVEDVPNVAEEKVQFIIDLRFQSDNLFENVHDVSLEDKSENLHDVNLEDKTCVEDDEIFYLSGMIDFLSFLISALSLTVRSRMCSKIKLKKLK